MNSLFILSLVVTLMIMFSTLYSLDKLRKGYGANLPPYLGGSYINPKKATERHKFVLLVQVMIGFLCSIIGIILVIKSV